MLRIEKQQERNDLEINWFIETTEFVEEVSPLSAANGWLSELSAQY